MPPLFVGDPGYTDFESYARDLMRLRRSVRFVMNESSGVYEEEGLTTTNISNIT